MANAYGIANAGLLFDLRGLAWWARSRYARRHITIDLFVMAITKH
jgi:hypothetical protein